MKNNVLIVGGGPAGLEALKRSNPVVINTASANTVIPLDRITLYDFSSRLIDWTSVSVKYLTPSMWPIRDLRVSRAETPEGKSLSHFARCPPRAVGEEVIQILFLSAVFDSHTDLATQDSFFNLFEVQDLVAYVAVWRQTAPVCCKIRKNSMV